MKRWQIAWITVASAGIASWTLGCGEDAPQMNAKWAPSDVPTNQSPSGVIKKGLLPPARRGGSRVATATILGAVVSSDSNDDLVVYYQSTPEDRFRNATADQERGGVRVRVNLTRRPPKPGFLPSQVLLISSTVVVLEKPLGDRVIRDQRGEVVPRRRPSGFPPP